MSYPAASGRRESGTNGSADTTRHTVGPASRVVSGSHSTGCLFGGSKSVHDAVELGTASCWRILRVHSQGAVRMRAMTIALLFAASLVAVGPVRAQSTTGTISGRVVDAQGLALPGVTITALSPNL